AQIGRLQTTLAQLVRQRDEMAEDVRKHKAVLLSVRRVPPELLCTIFSMLLLFSRRLAGSAMNQAPWHLGHVCRSWREAAVSDPSLW
ncbi:hypothetical protein FB451DRAFT_956486, partial [Mycena latifolia]